MTQQPVGGFSTRFLRPAKLIVQWRLQLSQVVQPTHPGRVFLHDVRLDAVAPWHYRLVPVFFPVGEPIVRRFPEALSALLRWPFLR